MYDNSLNIPLNKREQSADIPLYFMDLARAE